MTLQIYPGPVPPDQSAGELATVTEAENRFIVSKAVNLVRRDLDCTAHEAIAAICRDWMELRQIQILGDNELEHSTPVDFKPPTLWDRLKKFL